MPPISIMIKPSSSSCNLACTYCFYHSLSQQREKPEQGKMNKDALELILKKAFDFTKGSTVSISFQGGEPLLSGKEFYKYFLEILPKLNIYKSPVNLAIQTNGILIDEEWCAIFKKGSFLVGLSLDGDEDANSYRMDTDGEPAFHKIIKAASLLKKQNVTFNVLAVVTKKTAERIEQVYSYFKRNNFKHLQFIPCLRPLKQADKYLKNNDEEIYKECLAADDFYLSAEDYSVFLKKCFTLYTRDFIDGKYTSIRFFDNMVCLANSKKAEQCGLNGHCSHQYVIEANGDVYPCDFYCVDEYLLGNINDEDTDFSTLEQSEKAVNFIEESFDIEEKCKLCNCYSLCKNGCKRERIDLDKCKAHKEFFPYALPFLKRMS